MKSLSFDKIYSKIPHTALFISFGKWTFLGSIVGILCGFVCAYFLKTLKFVTTLRIKNPWLLFLLPIGGAFVSYIYKRYGKNSIKGNDLILGSIHHSTTESVPLIMTPLILLGTIITHLLGGSVGREGTAVQVGGSISSFVGKIFHLNNEDRRKLVICGISSGFSSVFGTPIAGTIFGMEVLSIGCIKYEALIPCVVGSIVGDMISSQLGAKASHYTVYSINYLSLTVILKVIVCSIIFAFTSILFSELIHFFKHKFSCYFKNPVIKSLIGGCIIIILTYIFQSRDYLGLGEDIIEKSFYGKVSPVAFMLKILFTSITLGTGFQGGEVTPIFFIGATLGNTLSGIFNLPPSFLAALGFICLFCGAINAPITSFVLAVELFGANDLIYIFIACGISYLFSGHHGIYTEQGIAVSKSRLITLPKDATLESVNNHDFSIFINNKKTSFKKYIAK